MKTARITAITALLVLTLGVLGCTQKTASPQDAIEKSKTFTTVNNQVNYLVGQANAFMQSKQANEAIQIAQYILTNLDKNSQPAQSIIQQAKAELEKAAKGALDNVANKLGNLGK